MNSSGFRFGGWLGFRSRDLGLRWWMVVVLAMAIGGAVTPNQATAEPAASASDDELAQTAQNPIGDLISVPIQNNTSFSIGPFERTQNVTNIQPVVPFDVGPVRVITRTILPLIYQPDVGAPSGGTFGTGNLDFTPFLSPINDKKLTWGVGPVFVFPTNSSDDLLQSDKYSVGLSGVAIFINGPWLLGTLVKNWWSVGGGNASDPDVNSFILQPFLSYTLGKGWYLTSSPIISADWEQSSGNQWLVPLGGGVGKVFAIGKQRFNSQIQMFGNVVKPDDIPHPDWGLRLQIQALFPK